MASTARLPARRRPEPGPQGATCIAQLACWDGDHQPCWRSPCEPLSIANLLPCRVQAWLPAGGPRLASFWLGGLGVLSMTWLLGQHHRCMLRALAAFTVADDAVWR